MKARIVALYRHPLKSGRPVARDVLHFDAFGVAGDRELMLVDADGKFITARKDPRVAQTRVQVLPRRWVFEHPRAASPLTVDRPAQPVRGSVAIRVWGDAGLGHPCGGEAAAWFSAVLQKQVRLICRPSTPQRPVDPDYTPRFDADAGFTDGFPILVVNLASLRALNRELQGKGVPPVDTLRFRPNIVVDGPPAWSEDTWSRLETPHASLVAAKPCVRCVFTTVDIHRAKLGREPLETLARLRSDVSFGVNLVHSTSSATIAIGDELEIETRQPT